jgi:hypothetical protein
LTSGSDDDDDGPAVMSSSEEEDVNKPRIWSIADVATSCSNRPSTAAPNTAAACLTQCLTSSDGLNNGFQPWTNNFAGSGCAFGSYQSCPTATARSTFYPSYYGGHNQQHRVVTSYHRAQPVQPQLTSNIFIQPQPQSTTANSSLQTLKYVNNSCLVNGNFSNATSGCDVPTCVDCPPVTPTTCHQSAYQTSLLTNNNNVTESILQQTAFKPVVKRL